MAGVAEETAIDIVAQQTKCAKDGAEVDTGSRIWSVNLCDRQFLCRSSSQAAFPDACSETPESTERTAQKISADRLALETSCPSASIHLVETAAWTRGDERAYRFTACGKPYVCTTAAGRTDCKAALASAAPAQ
jgi:hypothetical protein